MQQVTIGTKNQIVLPKEIRKKIKGLQPGRKVSVYSVNEDTITIKVSDKNWLENSFGAMKGIWKGRDLAKELEKMRDEWDEAK